jgi:hypothetical protein
LSQISQIDEERRSVSLRPIAILSLEPEELAKRYGLEFRPDQRQTSVAALLETPSGQYMLLRHIDGPTPGTELLAAEASWLPPDRQLRQFLAAVDLNDDVVAWALDR